MGEIGIRGIPKMDQQGLQDNRRITRWQIDRQAQVKLEGAESYSDCRIKDISLRGARIILKQALSMDTFIRLSIRLAGDHIFEAQVWLVWHKTIADTNVYGMYFSKIGDRDKEVIYKFMLKHSSRLVYNKWWEGLGKTEGGDAMEDRRIFSRFSVQLPVKFLNLSKNEEGTAETQDISAKGIGFSTSAEIAAQTPLEIWLKIPDKGEPLYTRGKVVWSKLVQPNKYRVGVDLEKADLMGLSRVLRTI